VLVAVERPDLTRAVVAIDPGYLVPDEASPGLAWIAGLSDLSHG
jgi:hypothetical protein